MDAADGPVDRPSFLIRYRLWLLLLLTGVAGVARFGTLDRPPLWGDEAFTYYRVSGTYHQLLDIIQFNGFPPLHYEAYWELKQAHKLTPRTMRLIPATAGTLMVPAMYFLASQLVRRRVALLVALFTCCSAYMMVYSHDAKMYMSCWLFVALHMGCLFWWLRRGRSNVGRIAWLAWIASGIVAVGLHYSAILLLPLELIICLTYPLVVDSPTLWKRVLLYLLGVAVVAAGPIGFFIGFNRIGEKFEQRGFAWGSETMWVESYNLDRGPMDLALYTATAHLYSWEWPLSTEKHRVDPDKLHPDLIHSLMIVGTLLLLLFAIACMPWLGRSKIRRSDSAAGLLPWWLLYLWFGLWIVATSYGLYCASTKQFASPVDAAVFCGDFIGNRWHWLSLFGEIAILAWLCRFVRGFAVALAAAIPIIALLALAAAFLAPSATPWDARYWLAITNWWRWTTNPLVLLILIGALPALAWHFSGAKDSERAKRLAFFVAVSALIFGACWIIWKGFDLHVESLVKRTMNEHHVDRAAAEREVWATWLSLWMPRYLGVLWPAVAVGACALLSRLPTRPLRYLAVVLLLGVNVAQATARLIATTEPPADKIVADIAASQAGSKTRTYLIGMAGAEIPSPGSLSVVGFQARYYLSQATTRSVKPHDFKFSPLAVAQTEKLWGFEMLADRTATDIAKDANASPSLNRLVVWEKLPPGWKKLPPGTKKDILDDLKRTLGPAWQLNSQEIRTGHDHWTWTKLWLLNRYEFDRTSPR